MGWTEYGRAREDQRLRLGASSRYGQSVAEKKFLSGSSLAGAGPSFLNIIVLNGGLFIGKKTQKEKKIWWG